MSECLFKNDFSSLKEDQVEELFPKNMIINMDKELPLADLLVETKAAQSKREAREFIKNGAILINGNQEKDENKVFGAKNGLFNKYLILRRGKKNYYLIKY